MIPTLLLSSLVSAWAADAPGVAAPPHRWDITDVRVDVTVDPAAHTVNGQVWHTIAPLGVPSDTLRLHQVALHITGVDVDGVAIPSWRTLPDAIDIPVTPGVGHVVHLTWESAPQVGAHFRGRDSSRGVVEAWSQGEDEDNRAWLPLWDYPSDRFHVSMAITAPTHLTAFANGLLVDRVAAARPGFTTTRYTMDPEMVGYLIAFAVGDYQTIPLGDTQAGDHTIPVELIAPRTMKIADARRGLDRVGAMIPWFGELLGAPYAYPVYRQVIVQRFMYGAMENASMTTMGDNQLSDDDGVDYAHTESTAAHELAHQWFGDLISCDGWRELWLNEGFATFYAARWAEHTLGREAYAGQVLDWARGAATTDGPVSKRGWSPADAPDNQAVYIRGATALHMLRVWLGDAAYDHAIRRYVAASAGRLAETDDLRRAFEAEAGEDLSWFFDRWIHGWGAPTFDTRWSESSGSLSIVVKQTGDQPYLGPVTITWADDSGEHVAHGSFAQDTAEWTRPATQVRWVMVDPEGGVLANWTRHQSPANWAAQLRESTSPYARILAARALGKPDGDVEVAVPVLAEALKGGLRAAVVPEPEHDTFRLAREAADALGELGTPAARDALLSALADAPAVVREEIASALGKFALDDGAVAALDKLVKRDRSPSVVAAALDGLAEARPSVARQDALNVLGAGDDSMQGARHAAALDVLGDHGKPGDATTVLRFTSDKLAGVQRRAGSALVALAKLDEAPKSAKDDAAKALLPWLHHDDMRTRQAGISLLARLGSDAALPALRATAATTTVAELRDSLYAAITSIRSANGDKSDPDALVAATAKLEEMEKKIEELEARVGKVEAQ